MLVYITKTFDDETGTRRLKGETPDVSRELAQRWIRDGFAVTSIGGAAGLNFRRLANKASREPLNQAPLRVNGETVLATDVRRLSGGQLVVAGVGGVLGASEPVFSSTTSMSDGAATWWPLNETTQAAPSGITTATYSITQAVSSRPVIFNIFGNPGLVSRPSAPNLNYVSGSGNTVRANSWAILESPAQDNGFGANGRQGKWATYEFETASPNIDIGFMPVVTGYTRERMNVWIDDRPLSESPIVPTTATGQNAFVTAAITGPARTRTIRIGCFGPLLLSYIAVDAGFTITPSRKRGLTLLWGSDSYGDTEGPVDLDTPNYDMAVKVSQLLGFPHVIHAGVGGTSYSVNNGTRRSYRNILANNDLRALNPDAVLLAYGGNAANGGIAASVETAEARVCWDLTRAACPVQTIIICGTWYRRPGFTAQHDALQEALKAEFLAMADPNSAFVDPHDGSVILGDGSVVIKPSAAWLNSSNVSWAMVDPSHPTPSGKAYVLVPKLVEACDAVFNALA